MKKSLIHIISALAALLLAGTLAQNPATITFQTNPVLVQSNTQVVFTVNTVTNFLSMTWTYQGGVPLGLYSGGRSVIDTTAQFQGRITISANQLQIGGAQLRDAGNYTVEVIPSASTNLSRNAQSVQLRVFDKVDGISLSVPSVAVENANVSLSCTWTSGTEVSVQWGKGGSNIAADSRISISGGSLLISPASRGDTGDYTCTAQNLVSAQTATKTLTVYYGPDPPVVTVNIPKNCVGGGDVLVGQTARLTCTSNSLPPAVFSWQRDGQPTSSDQPGGGVLTLQTFSTNDSGQYTCTAKNSVTGGTSQQPRNLAVVGVCLDGGEVAGIVIGCFVAVLIIVLLIVFLVILARRRRANQSQIVVEQKTNPNQRPIPQDPQPNPIRDLDQGPQPPPDIGLLDGPNTHPLNTHHIDGLNTRPPVGFNAVNNLNAVNDLNMVNDLTIAHRENRFQMEPLPNSELHQRNQNRLLNDAFHNTNTHLHNGIDNSAFTDAPNARQQNPNIVIQAGNQQPSVQVSLNATPQANAQLPVIHVNLNSFANGQQTDQGASFPFNDPSLQTQPNLVTHANPTMQSGHFNPDQSRLVPTGHTHVPTSQRNANTQTYQDISTRRGHQNTPNSTQRHLPWDLLRGTPAYPNSTTPDHNPDYTSDYTSDLNPQTPIQRRADTRSRSRSRSPPRRRTPPRFDSPSTDEDTWSPSVRPRRHDATTDTQPIHAQRSPHTQRETSQIPGAILVMPQQASGWQPVAVAERLPIGQQGADTRALADPNHLQQRPAPTAQTLQVLAVRPAPPPVLSAQPGFKPLTQTALRDHTQRAQVFQNRIEQTQAALNHPGPRQAPGVSAATTRKPPTPPPIISMQQFESLPRERSQHSAPQRPRHPVIMATNHHHHHHNTQRHAAGPQPHTHHTQPRQVHRGRPR